MGFNSGFKGLMESKIKLLPRPNNTLKSYTRHAGKFAFLVLQPCGK